MNKGKPEVETLKITKSQDFELITSCHFKNLISQKPTLNSRWNLLSSRNLQRQHHCPYPAHISDFFFKDFSENPVLHLDMGI